MISRHMQTFRPANNLCHTTKTTARMQSRSQNVYTPGYRRFKSTQPPFDPIAAARAEQAKRNRTLLMYSASTVSQTAFSIHIFR